MNNIDFLKDLLQNATQAPRRFDQAPLPGINPSPTFPSNSPQIPDLNAGATPMPDEPLPVIPPPPPMNLPPVTPGAAAPVTVQPAAPALPEIGSPEAAYNELTAPDRYGKEGKGRNKKWSTLEKIGSALAGWATGGLAGGVMAATDRNFFNKIHDQNQINRLLPAIESRNKQRTLTRQDQQLERQNRLTEAQIRNLDTDNKYQVDRLGEMKLDRTRKEGDTKARQETARMNAVAGMFKSLPAYDPNDARFGDLTKALGDAKLPIGPKDAKKNVKLVQDQRTGDWSTILTDPVTGAQETRPVFRQDGTPFKSTPTVVMQGEYRMLKQNDQQGFTEAENAKQRAFTAQQDALKAQMQAAVKAYEQAAGVNKLQIQQQQKAELMRLKKQLENLQP